MPVENSLFVFFPWVVSQHKIFRAVGPGARGGGGMDGGMLDFPFQLSPATSSSAILPDLLRNKKVDFF